MFTCLEPLFPSNALSEAQFAVTMGNSNVVPSNDSMFRRCKDINELHLGATRSLMGDSLLDEQPEAAVDVVAVVLLLLLVTETNCSYSMEEHGAMDIMWAGVLLAFDTGGI